MTIRSHLSSSVVSTRTLPSEIDEVIELPTIQLEEIDESQLEEIDESQRGEQLPTIHLEENVPQEQIPALAVSAVAENVDTSVRDAEVHGGDSTRNINYTDTRAEFVSVTFWKDHPNIPLGINFRNGLPEVRINSLTDGSLAADSPLRAGDKVLSVNSKQVSNNQLNQTQVANILRESFGCVTLVVHNQGGNSDLVESMIMKSHPEEKVGIKIRTYQGAGRMAVSSIVEGEKFQNSLLNPGDTVLTVNGTSVAQLELSEVLEIIKNAPEKVTILARTLRETGVVVAELSDRYMATCFSMPVLQGTPPNAVTAATNSHATQNSNINNRPTTTTNINNRPTGNHQPPTQVQQPDGCSQEVSKNYFWWALCVLVAIVAGIVIAVTSTSDDDDGYSSGGCFGCDCPRYQRPYNCFTPAPTPSYWATTPWPSLPPNYYTWAPTTTPYPTQAPSEWQPFQLPTLSPESIEVDGYPYVADLSAFPDGVVLPGAENVVADDLDWCRTLCFVSEAFLYFPLGHSSSPSLTPVTCMCLDSTECLRMEGDSSQFGINIENGNIYSKVPLPTDCTMQQAGR